MTTNMDIQKRAMIKALEKSLGIVTKACAVVDIARSTHYTWMENDSEYKAAVDSIQDISLDFAESKLFEKIEGVTIQKGEDEDGNPNIYDVPPSDTAIIFFLKTKGKKRGYIERSEVDISGHLGTQLIERQPDEQNQPID